EAGVESAAAAEQVVAENKSRVVRIVVTNIQIHAGEEVRIRLVRRFKRLTDRRDIFEGIDEPLEWMRTLPVTEKIRSEFRDLFIVEIADYGQLYVRTTIEVGVELLDILKLRCLHLFDILIRGGDVTDVALRIRIE